MGRVGVDGDPLIHNLFTQLNPATGLREEATTFVRRARIHGGHHVLEKADRRGRLQNHRILAGLHGPRLTGSKRFLNRYLGHLGGVELAHIVEVSARPARPRAVTRPDRGGETNVCLAMICEELPGIHHRRESGIVLHETCRGQPVPARRHDAIGSSPHPVFGRDARRRIKVGLRGEIFLRSERFDVFRVIGRQLGQVLRPPHRLFDGFVVEFVEGHCARPLPERGLYGQARVALKAARGDGVPSIANIATVAAIQVDDAVLRARVAESLHHEGAGFFSRELGHSPSHSQSLAGSELSCTPRGCARC